MQSPRVSCFYRFVETPKRDQVEAVAMAGKADGVIVKITIADDERTV